ncbi:MAG: hypothetical protein WC852_05765 [Candidatus Nanoarchaeia archaeon]
MTSRPSIEEWLAKKSLADLKKLGWRVRGTADDIVELAFTPAQKKSPEYLEFLVSLYNPMSNLKEIKEKMRKVYKL